MALSTQPGRRWEIFVVQHAHIDIGYTERQEVVYDWHAEFVRQAVNLALDPRQSSRAEDVRFKFTCEGFWQVEQFLARASSDDMARFARAIKEGLIELSAFGVHLTELLDAGHLRDTLRPAEAFARRHGLPLDVAMACDINGFSWSMADALADAGVKYLSVNINQHHGGYPFDRPLVPFWWESPTGRRVLVWNGYAYHRTNSLGLMPGGTYDGESHTVGADVDGDGAILNVTDPSFAEGKIPRLLTQLEANGYPYDFLLLAGSGEHTDNGPPGDAYCDLLAEWNKRRGQRIHLRTATLGEFFAHLQSKVRQIPTFRGEWTDWWSEGVAATPLDTQMFCNAQRVKRTVERLDPEHKAVSPERLSEIGQALTMYAEHTYGHSHPLDWGLLCQQVFRRKSEYAITADRLAGAALVDVLRSRGEGPFRAARPFEYSVINSLPVKRRTHAGLPLEWYEGYLNESGVQVIDEQTGAAVPHQIDSVPRGTLATIIVDLEPGEQRRFRIEPAGAKPAAVTGLGPVSSDVTFENSCFKMRLSPTGGIASLIDASTGRELLDLSAGGLGRPVYQRFFNVSRADVAGARRQDVSAMARAATRLDPAEPAPPIEPKVSPERFPSQITHGACRALRATAAGSLFCEWELDYELPDVRPCTLIVRCWRDLPQLELSLRFMKHHVLDPDGVYVQFPFVIEDGAWHLDKPGGPIRPGIDQLPGACCDYYLVQRGAALVGRRSGVAVSTLDAPMVMIGGLRLWTFARRIDPTGTLYSWLTNNKWETNFMATTGGCYHFRYVVECGDRFNSAAEAVAACSVNTDPAIAIRH